MIEHDLASVLAPAFDALAAINANSAPDHSMRLRAAEALLDRGYGKASPRTEMSSPEGGAFTIEMLALAARRVLSPGTEVEGFEPVTTFDPVTTSNTS